MSRKSIFEACPGTPRSRPKLMKGFEGGVLCKLILIVSRGNSITNYEVQGCLAHICKGLYHLKIVSGILIFIEYP